MIRIGLRAEFDFVPEAATLGYDYLELPLNRVAALSDAEFRDMAEYMDALDVRAETMYAMLPEGMRVNGNDVRARDQHEYLDLAFARARRLGAEVIAFDAPAARSVPAAFDFSMARRQTGNFLRIVQGHAVQFGVRVGIQNFRHGECNLINTVSEAALMSSLLQLSQVGVWADAVQMAYASEPLEALTRCGSELMHVCAGGALSRALPADDDGEDYVKLFRVLIRQGYFGRMTAVSARPCTLQAAAKALEVLTRAQMKAQL